MKIVSWLPKYYKEVSTVNKIKKDDLVVVIAGKDKDKQGKVISVDTKKNKVLVQGCNMVTKHTKQAQAAHRAASLTRKLLLISPM